MGEILQVVTAALTGFCFWGDSPPALFNKALCKLGGVGWVLVLSTFCLAWPQSLQAEEAVRTGKSQEASDKRVVENYRDMLDRVAPLHVEGDFSYDLEWRLIVRIIPAFESLPESWFSIQKHYSGRISADVAVPEGDSLSVQMRKLKSKYPDSSSADMSELLVIQRHQVDVDNFRQLGDIVDKLNAISISPTLSNEFFLDATSYEFRSESRMRTMDIKLVVPPGSQIEAAEALIQWAEETRKILVQHVTGTDQR